LFQDTLTLTDSRRVEFPANILVSQPQMQVRIETTALNYLYKSVVFFSWRWVCVRSHLFTTGNRE